jgi:four helix bundle protein
MGERIRSVRDLTVYQKAFDSAMKIFEITKRFPKEEMYSLTDQIRRSSRSVCTNIAEGCLRPRGAEECLYMSFKASELVSVT